VDRLPALPRPLADLLGARGRRLDRIGGLVAGDFAQVTRLEFTEHELDAVHEPFASDGFHPGAPLHNVFAHEISARLTVPDLMRTPDLMRRTVR
jgi:hypothetical protein